jgi:uncharacterized DUF497 family protein
MSLIFEWDEEKADANLKKHGVGFDEARTIFNDPFSITIHDPNHSVNEHSAAAPQPKGITPSLPSPLEGEG